MFTLTTLRVTIALVICCLGFMAASKTMGSILPYSGEIAYEDSGIFGNHIYVVDVNRGVTANLTHGLVSNAYQPTWSPDGRQMAFTSYPCNACGNNIYVMDMATRVVRQLTHVFGTINLDLAWSPDGRQLALTGALDRTLDHPGGVYTLDVDDGEFRRMSGDTLNERAPTWTPDSSEITFVATTSRSHFSVFITNEQTVRLLSSLDNRNARPSWSPDGQRLVVASSQGRLRVLTIDENGVQNDRLIGVGILPIWSPRGDLIAYMSPSASLLSSNQLSRIYVVNPDGSGERPLGDFNVDWVLAFTWSPDGSHLMFVSYCDAGFTCIYVMDAASGQVWRARRYGRWCRPEECHVAWRPT